MLFALLALIDQSSAQLKKISFFQNFWQMKLNFDWKHIENTVEHDVQNHITMKGW